MNFLDQYKFSPTRKEVAELVISGKATKDVADITGLKIAGVNYHLNVIYRVVGVANRYELMIKSFEFDKAHRA